jgi:hypothetical protein
MKHLNIIGIIICFTLFTCNKYYGNNNIIVEINNDEILILNSIIDNLLMSDVILDKKDIIINKSLFVNNYFEGDCGCFEDENNNHEYTYESMVKNTDYYVSKLELNNEIIKSFINSNINKKYMKNDIQFISGILIKDEVLENLFSTSRRKDRKNIITFSNIGFNNGKDEALIFVSFENTMDLPISSYGKYIYLIKENETWNIMRYEYSWFGG